MAPGASTKGLEQALSGLWRADIGSTVHFHGPGVPFLESLGRMASGVKANALAYAMLPGAQDDGKKNGPKRLRWPPYGRGGLKSKKKMRQIGRELTCGVREPPPFRV